MGIFLIGLAIIFFIAQILKFIDSGKNNLLKKNFNKSKSAWTQQNIQPYPSVAEVSDVSNNENQIIDITPVDNNTNTNTDTNTNTNTNKSTVVNTRPAEVPVWEYRYMFSYSEILKTTDERRQFYFYFRDRFLEDEYLDLKGNINYAFILMYELLDRYNADKNISELTRLLKLLGLHYPGTKSQTNNHLIQKMKELGNFEAAEDIFEEEYHSWKLGGRYKTKFNLSKEEARHLNQLYFTHNKFNSIELCLSRIIRFYFAVIEELKNRYIREGTTIDVEFNVIVHLQMANRNAREMNTAKNAIYSHIFKCCENAIREFCGCSKLSVDTGYSRDIQKVYEERILLKTTDIISSLIKKESPIDIKQIYYLFPQLQTKYLKDLKKNYSDSKYFYDEVLEMNIHDSESIFYSATTFMLKHDKEVALKLYVYYLSSAIKNHQILTERRLIILLLDQKKEEAMRGLKKKYPIITQIYELNTRIFNSSFNNKEQSAAFKTLLTNFIWNKKRNEMANSIPEIFRKKIQINTKSISEIQRQHTESVLLLNEYLNDESEDEINTLPQTENATVVDIEFSQIQLTVLSLFAENGFSIPRSDLETFAKSNSVMKNQLVESINELCYELLDDVLIEEDDEYYTIDPRYYQKIQAK